MRKICQTSHDADPAQRVRKDATVNVLVSAAKTLVLDLINVPAKTKATTAKVALGDTWESRSIKLHKRRRKRTRTRSQLDI